MPSREIPFVPQVQLADCAAACLASVLAYHGVRLPLRSLRSLTNTGRDGATAGDIARAARALGFAARGVRAQREGLASLPTGTILHRTDAHFVVLGRVRGDRVVVVDPAYGVRRLTRAELAESCSGVAVLIEGRPAAQPDAEPAHRALSLLAGLLAPHRGRLAALALVSAAIQSLVFLTPVVVALALRADERGWRPSAPMLLAGAAVVVGAAVAALRLRARLLLRVRLRIDAELVGRFVRTLVDLPLAFFESRTTGDLLARVNSSAAIRDAVSAAAVASVLDGLSAVVVVAALAFVSVPLALATLAITAFVVCFAVATGRRYRGATTETQSARAAAQGELASLVFNMEQVKAQGVEHRVADVWEGRFRTELAAVERSMRLAQRVTVLGDTARFTGPAAVLALVLATGSPEDVRRLVPLVVAVAACLAPVANLVNTGMALVAARTHVLRLVDILDEPVDDTIGRPRLELATPPEVAVSGVRYAYPGSRTPAVHGADLRLAPGTLTVLVGGSGSGKSTLLKLVLGLMRPDAGVVTVAGRDLASVDTQDLRGRVGVVTQQVSLTAGTVADNVLVGRERDDARLAAALRRSGAAEFVDALPLGLGTPLSDRGASLSGGQRQRIALARAFYADPTLFVLDEATSQLDPAGEAFVVDSLVATGATVLLVTHRPLPLRRADQVVLMAAGRVVRTGTHDALLADPVYEAFWTGGLDAAHGAP